MISELALIYGFHLPTTQPNTITKRIERNYRPNCVGVKVEKMKDWWESQTPRDVIVDEHVYRASGLDAHTYCGTGPRT
jgi:hypothetical protein